MPGPFSAAIKALQRDVVEASRSARLIDMFGVVGVLGTLVGLKVMRRGPSVASSSRTQVVACGKFEMALSASFAGFQ